MNWLIPPLTVLLAWIYGFINDMILISAGNGRAHFYDGGHRWLSSMVAPNQYDRSFWSNLKVSLSWGLVATWWLALPMGLVLGLICSSCDTLLFLSYFPVLIIVTLISCWSIAIMSGKMGRYGVGYVNNVTYIVLPIFALIYTAIFAIISGNKKPPSDKSSTAH